MNFSSLFYRFPANFGQKIVVLSANERVRALSQCCERGSQSATSAHAKYEIIQENIF